LGSKCWDNRNKKARFIMTEIAVLIARIEKLEQQPAIWQEIHEIRRIQCTYGYFSDQSQYNEVVDPFSDDGGCLVPGFLGASTCSLSTAASSHVEHIFVIRRSSWAAWPWRVKHSRMASKFSHIEIDSEAMVVARKESARREAMGGLAKGLAVIRTFTRERASLSLSEIARSADMPAATARRCLLTLEELGYVARYGREFVLRPKVLELGATYLESMNIEQLTKTHLEELARHTGDSAALCVLDDTEVVYVARASVRTLLRLEAHVGSRFPAHATSTGRVLLAGLSPERLQHYFAVAKLEALTERTVTDPRRLRQLIEDGRRNAYAAVEDELAYGVIALAVPVLDQLGRVVAALNSSGHSKKTSKAKLVRERLDMLQQVSRQISSDLRSIPGLSISARI
jgi:IclR family pca regulon transcriptional regulator